MAVRSGMYSADKRRKELKRMKKQEEKRLKRQNSVKNSPKDAKAGPVDSKN
ncbi:MAG: hypothetical protein HY809_01665 [Nitrospirae bacterium]|nr:hypothetical protein [Nitrospirota bacterium]